MRIIIPNSETKTMRVPLALEAEVRSLVEKYKIELAQGMGQNLVSKHNSLEGGHNAAA